MFADHAKRDREKFLREQAQNSVRPSPDNAEKVRKAIAYLGSAYILHPNYKRSDHPEHSRMGSAILGRVALKALSEGRL